MSHVLFFTCLFQALHNESAVYSGRRVLIALERYMAHIENGILIHGPLLGWVTIMGGELAMFCSDTRLPHYLMPRRIGVSAREYPWSQHGARQY